MQKKGKMISEKKATPYEQILCALAANVKRVAGISLPNLKPSNGQVEKSTQ